MPHQQEAGGHAEGQAGAAGSPSSHGDGQGRGRRQAPQGFQGQPWTALRLPGIAAVSAQRCSSSGAPWTWGEHPVSSALFFWCFASQLLYWTAAVSDGASGLQSGGLQSSLKQLRQSSVAYLASGSSHAAAQVLQTCPETETGEQCCISLMLMFSYFRILGCRIT